jgi:hypothetical protein
MSSLTISHLLSVVERTPMARSAAQACKRPWGIDGPRPTTASGWPEPAFAGTQQSRGKSCPRPRSCGWSGYGTTELILQQLETHARQADAGRGLAVVPVVRRPVPETYDPDGWSSDPGATLSERTTDRALLLCRMAQCSFACESYAQYSTTLSRRQSSTPGTSGMLRESLVHTWWSRSRRPRDRAPLLRPTLKDLDTSSRGRYNS